MREWPEDRPPTDEELQDLLADYMLVQATTDEEREIHSLAFMDAGFMVEDHPEAAWRFVKLAAASKLPMPVAGYVAASVLEDLLGHHGETALKLIEPDARRDPSLQFMLSMVWRGFMSDETWRRFESLRDDLAIPRM